MKVKYSFKLNLTLYIHLTHELNNLKNYFSEEQSIYSEIRQKQKTNRFE